MRAQVIRNNWPWVVAGLTCCGLVLSLPGTSPAQERCSSSPWLGRYVDRILATTSDQPLSQNSPQLMPAGFLPWWQEGTTRPLRAEQARPIDVPFLMAAALATSHQVKVFEDIPTIRQTTIGEAEGVFRPQLFADTRYADTSDPVGNTLQTGGPNRYLNNQWQGALGVRRKNTLGGHWELSERLGFQNTNSLFFVPNDQGTARLTLRYTQPLLNGFGTAYNTSLIALARLDTRVAEDELIRQVQAHLLEVTRAYWSLYQERAILLQKVSLLNSGRQVLQAMEDRGGLDASAAQIQRVRAAVASREATLVRAQTSILNAEGRVRALVNDESLPGNELLPLETPQLQPVPVSMRECLLLSLDFRPEVRQALRQLEAGRVREYQAAVERKPAFNVIAEGYAPGLRGDSEIGQAMVDQFSVGQPSYLVGVVYEQWLHNQVGNSRLTRRQLEVRQLAQQLRSTIETLLLEVEVAAREVDTAYREMQAKFAALAATQEELRTREDRWRQLPGDDTAASVHLENLLQSQERLADAEASFVTAQVIYSLALLNLERAQGTLLMASGVVQWRGCEEGLPSVRHQMPVTGPEGLERLPPPAADPGGAEVPASSRRTIR